MREFFRGWRRQVGVLTLLLELVVITAWCRAQNTSDWMVMCSNDRMYRLESASSDIALIRDFDPPPVDGFPVWFGPSLVTMDVLDGIDEMFPQSTLLVSVPHWSVVIPLTFISLWLLLKKPRNSNQEKTGETIPAVGP